MADDTDWFAEKQEKQQERCYWRRVGFIAFIAILMVGGVVLALYSKKAHADALVARSGGDSVRLLTEPCKNAAVLDQLKPEYHERFRAGEGNIGGKKYALCWIANNGNVFLIYEDGDKGQAPMSVFERESGV